MWGRHKLLKNAFKNTIRENHYLRVQMSHGSWSIWNLSKPARKLYIVNEKLKLAGLVVILLISSIFGLASAWRQGLALERYAPTFYHRDTEGTETFFFSVFSVSLWLNTDLNLIF